MPAGSNPFAGSSRTSSWGSASSAASLMRPREQRDFTDVDADLRAAIDAFCARVPSLREVVIWGLCDAASAALFYAQQDERVTGLVLLNPWAHTEDGHAKATLKHYYGARLFDLRQPRK